MDSTILHFISQSAVPTGWEFWPFTSGTGESWLPLLARLAFLVAIFAVIAGFLRILHGPKGLLRDKELDAEAEELRRKELDELKREYERGDWSERQYLRHKRRIERS
ncbi:Uncharacterized membrane protein [Paucidesulfovibrio gracilis DSM 16080]|uniref:Uncharacterized membrane protein n=1 Tax=Paucidesulfovibrio gracilis DSM 16080 TaxID=1121449 RepID=A0A1T4XAW3_9BACT|nr:hypothetical protein [Paucidesulfovibrio gracilis]SKA86744.1 Uncharacterized membrane protein [Paucidesulfovibrio gracilis DSM 16080]